MPSRQWKWAKKMRRQNRCRTCGKRTPRPWLCDKCYERQVGHARRAKAR